MTNRIKASVTAIVSAGALIAGLCYCLPVAATTPFIGTIKYLGFNFAPVGWAHCNGQLLQVSQNDALFALIGTTYGGDGVTTFALPDMRGRLPVHMGTGAGLTPRIIGQNGGSPTATLTNTQAGHSHNLQASTLAGNQSAPAGRILAQDGSDRVYQTAAPDVQMHANSVGMAGGNAAHNNQPPVLGVYCNIALFGIFPSRN